MLETGMDGRIQLKHVPITALGRKRFACVETNVFNADPDVQLKDLHGGNEDAIGGES